MEYHLRLRDQQRGILDASARDGWATKEPIEALLLRSAPAPTATPRWDFPAANWLTGEPADFFTVDLNDLSILGVDAARRSRPRPSFRWPNPPCET
jgi:hypothetical protein